MARVTLGACSSVPCLQHPLTLHDSLEGVSAQQWLLRLAAHTGTHVDAPYHFIDKGEGIESLDLNILIGWW